MPRPLPLQRLCASAMLPAVAIAGAQACSAVAGLDGEDLEAASEVAVHGAALVHDGSCSSAQWDAIVRASQGANWLLDDALANINSPENGNLRLSWFGSNIQTVEGNTAALFRILGIRYYANGTLPLTIRCVPQTDEKCINNAYAYHLPDQEVIQFCPLYFTYDHNQGDYDHEHVSQVGGLLHELSHLDGTSDFGGLFYGYDTARWLAGFNSDDAMNNADNWRYYLMQVP